MRISDWSSDVCSSDLEYQQVQPQAKAEIVVSLVEEIAVSGRQEQKGEGRRCRRYRAHRAAGAIGQGDQNDGEQDLLGGEQIHDPAQLRQGVVGGDVRLYVVVEIGRASCRARVCQYV